MKYHSRKTVVNGITFDSKLEADRYQQLLLLEKAGEICDLTLQMEFQIFHGYRDPEQAKKRNPLFMWQILSTWTVKRGNGSQRTRKALRRRNSGSNGNW